MKEILIEKLILIDNVSSKKLKNNIYLLSEKLGQISIKYFNSCKHNLYIPIYTSFIVNALDSFVNINQ